MMMLLVDAIDDKCDYGNIIMIYNTTFNAEENGNIYDFEAVPMTQTIMLKITDGDDNYCG